MKARWLIALLVAAAVGAAVLWFVGSHGDAQGGSATPDVTSKRGVALTVTHPLAGDAVASPVRVAGKVPGLWVFEGSFGLEVLDGHHKRLGDGYATVTGDWMTDKEVPFKATVKFTKPSTASGFLVLLNANPSGSKAHADSVEIPVSFDR